MTSFATDCLAGRHVLVTGASSGLGRDAAQSLARAGARLTLLGRDEERLHASAASLAGEQHRAMVAPMHDTESVADLIKRIASEGGILDGIFHCAGVELVRPARMMKNDHVTALFEASVHGSLGLARAAASRGVMSDAASLVFMSSVAGQRGTAGMVGYSAAKAAIDGLVRSLACELAPRRIRVNAIAAGAVETEMHERLSKNLGDNAMDDYRRRHLLGFGRPQDISNVALFLLSDASQWITGATIAVDGGYTAQ